MQNSWQIKALKSQHPKHPYLWFRASTKSGILLYTNPVLYLQTKGEKRTKTIILFNDLKSDNQNAAVLYNFQIPNSLIERTLKMLLNTLTGILLFLLVSSPNSECPTSIILSDSANLWPSVLRIPPWDHRIVTQYFLIPQKVFGLRPVPR